MISNIVPYIIPHPAAICKSIRPRLARRQKICYDTAIRTNREATAMAIRELNLEQGRPTADQALRWLEAELNAARKMNTPLMKLIHGYGSSGKGGRIRTASRRYLEEAAAQGRVAAYLPGERFTIFDETTRRALTRYPQLRSDRDLDRGNRGVTFVFFREF